MGNKLGIQKAGLEWSLEMRAEDPKYQGLLVVGSSPHSSFDRSCLKTSLYRVSNNDQSEKLDKK